MSDDISGASNVSQYIASFYFIVTTLSTVGFGDITATTTAERVMATIFMVIGAAPLLPLFSCTLVCIRAAKHSCCLCCPLCRTNHRHHRHHRGLPDFCASLE